MSPRLKHRIIAAGFRAIAASRAEGWLAPLARGRGVILTFHHVRPGRPDPFSPNALLSVTPDHLDRTIALVRDLGFEIVPLDEVPMRLGSDGPPFAALTFDDGYRDNLDYAVPILRRHGVPWTLFVVTDYADGRGRLWWLELEEVVRRLDALDLTPLGRPGTLPCGSTAEKERAFALAYADLRAGPEARLREVVARWCRTAGIDTDALVRRECLGWGDLLRLARDPLLTIGAHTLSHPMLAKHDAEMARREMAESRAILAERLGRTIRHLAYPVGDPASAGRREFALAEELGFATAVTTRPGHLFAGHARHLTGLPRVSINGLHQTEAATRALLSGVPFLLWNRGRRLDVA